ncbi:hypothetical protein Taro_049565 [Colocasia esculenta]|uniref:Uncharacterized protein n=1 Tax=Colocasia esculenta TaxID=4460 RepID=A0A843XBI4_COLES|nr:hypothetical protein [Colocasia esculenta]
MVYVLNFQVHTFLSW